MTSEQRKLNTVETKSQESKEWQTRKLDEIADINLGQSPKGEYYNEVGDGPHFIQGSKNFGNKYTELERFCSQPKREAKEGDVLISVRAPVGPVNIAPEDLCIGRGVTALRLNEGSNEFLFYFLKHFEDKWAQFADGTTFNSITKSDLENLDVPYFPLKERNKIASILSRLDEKIEVNNQIDDILDKIASNLFESWFVDYKSHNEFKSSKIGDVPPDFSVSSLETVLSFQRGFSYSGDDLIDEESDLEPSDGYPMINLGTTSPGGGYNADGIKYSRKLPKERYRIKSGDLVISHTDMTQDRKILGSPTLVPELSQEEMLFSHHLYKVTETNLPVEYLYYYFLSPYFKPKAENFASGTTVLSFSSKIASDVHIPIPPQSELDQYVEKVRPLFMKKEMIRKENDKIANLRDTLLPNLMSGEIRVDDIKLD